MREPFGEPRDASSCVEGNRETEFLESFIHDLFKFSGTDILGMVPREGALDGLVVPDELVNRIGNADEHEA